MKKRYFLFCLKSLNGNTPLSSGALLIILWSKLSTSFLFVNSKGFDGTIQMCRLALTFMSVLFSYEQAPIHYPFTLEISIYLIYLHVHDFLIEI